MKNLMCLGMIMMLVLVSAIPGLAEPNFSCADVTEVPLLECEALVALYNNTNGPSWTNNTNWLLTNTPSNWHGVTVSDGHVTKLDLWGNQLTGNIPAELSDLINLTRLVLGGNLLSGSIPVELGNLINLIEINLERNQLMGSIPIELGNLTNLRSLDFDVNQLSGSIPIELGNPPNLGYLSLGLNQLSGNIPDVLGNLSDMSFLYLAGNQLSGGIPVELGNLGNLTQLMLDGNQLSGSIPIELGNLNNLDYLSLGSNQLSGSIPVELGKLANLKYLILGGNQLSGSIPRELGDLINLRRLILSNNQLSGNIPTTLGFLINLWSLELSDNQLTGNIPSELGNLTNLRYLFLNNNLLEGDIPITFTNLINLYNPDEFWVGYDGLDLDYNFLTVPPGYPDPSDPLDAFLLLKDPTWHLRQGFEQEISTAGGEIISLDDSTKIIIQEDTLAGATTFTFLPQPAPESEPNNLAFAGNSFLLTAEDALGTPVTVFDPPLTVTLTYTDEDILGIPEETLALYYWDTASTAWVDAVTTCPGAEYTRDLAGNTLSLPICHLSEFGLFGSPIHVFLPIVVKR